MGSRRPGQPWLFYQSGKGRGPTQAVGCGSNGPGGVSAPAARKGERGLMATGLTGELPELRRSWPGWSPEMGERSRMISAAPRT